MPMSCGECCLAGAMKTFVRPRAMLCAAAVRSFSLPRANGYISETLCVVVRCREVGHHLNKEVGIIVQMGVRMLVGRGCHGLRYVAAFPHKGDGFGLQIVYHFR